jgi:ABC-type sugar transport system ATPase subunit
MATVYFDEATRRFSKDEAPAVDGITLDIADGEFLVLVGPSGCGKSTTLRMLAGLEPVDGGRVLVDGHDQKGVRPRDRDIAMVFQSYALYPNMTAAQNMAFALDNARVSKAETKQRVAEAAKILELEQLLDRKPGQMSGGQRQRVAMGRAIVRNPKVFCMDEPLSNLDAKLRVSTRSQIAGLQRRLGITTVYVTHDQVEAMTMVGLRPESWRVVATPDPRPAGDNGSSSSHGTSLALKVDLVESLGAESFVYGRPVGAEESGERVTVRLDRRTHLTVGDVVHVEPDPGEVHLFDAASGARIEA